MLYRPFGKLGWQVSAIGMGTWNIGNHWGEVDELTALATLRTAFDCGMNLYDTAESYGIPAGLSEERMGRGLAGLRHRVYIVSKIGHWGEATGQAVPKNTVDMIRLCAHAILGRLRTDWVDVLLCHLGDIQDPTVYLEAFEILKHQGYVRAYGISTPSLDALKRFNVHGTCEVVETDYSLINRAPEQALLPYCQEHGMAVLIRGPLRKGLLAGKYSPSSVFTDVVRDNWNVDGSRREEFEREVAQVEGLKRVVAPGDEMVKAALRYVISHPVNAVAIPGCKSPEQAIMNAAAGDKTFTEQERQTLAQAMS